jgi:hypothetical protein
MLDSRVWRDPAVVGGDGIEPPTSSELAEHDQGSRFHAVVVGSTSSRHTVSGRRYRVSNLYATIRATRPAKISSAGRDFRIVGLVEWRAADSPG